MLSKPILRPHLYAALDYILANISNAKDERMKFFPRLCSEALLASAVMKVKGHLWLSLRGAGQRVVPTPRVYQT